MEEVQTKESAPLEVKCMPASKAQQKAVNKYVKANYDLYQIKMPKGKKDDIKAVAIAAGESINQYIINAIDQRKERDAGSPQEAAGAALEGWVVSLPAEALKVAQEAAQAAGEGLMQFVTRAIESRAALDKRKRSNTGKGPGA